MKTCVFVTGRIKTWQDNFKSFTKHLENYDFDLYASLNCDINDKDANELSNLHFVKDVICHPTKYPKWLQDLEINCFLHQKFNFYSQCFHRFLVYNESKKFKIYDRYIFTRMDLITNQSLPKIKEYSDIVYCPKNNMHGLNSVVQNNVKFFFNDDVPLINDQILICNKNNVSSVANLFLEMTNMHSKQNVWWHPETMLHTYLNKKNIKIKTFDFEYTLDPKRNKPS